MKKIKSTYNTYSIWALSMGILLFVLSGCSISGVDKQSDEITEEDLQAAGQILGESLSDETSGIMGSLNDALTGISSDGFVRTTAAKSMDDDDDENSGRGRESNFSYSYDPDTGIHTLAFLRSVTKANFSKSVTDTLKYIFSDNNGAFIAFPRVNRERIETIDFKGFREGTVNSPSRNSFFARKDTFLIDGVSQASNILSIDGKHNGEGSFEGTNDEGNPLERDYELEINFLNVEIDKAVVQTNQSLEQGVTGTLTYELIVEKVNNGSSSTKTIRGTIEMNGDGSALLRFERFSKLFRINLDDGDVSDQDDEFEGKVTSVNLENSTFTLSEGRVIRITDETTFENDGDLFSLQAVAETLEAGKLVEAEGDGYKDGDVFVATQVKFEIEEEDDSIEGELNFDAFISSVSLENSTVTLQDERVIKITDDTVFDESGDFMDLESVRNALEEGQTVAADGKGVESEEEGITIVATRIEFELEESDSGDDGATD
ncbi:hypothetical protein G3570_10040 [Balneolaceae bacterium YR4-1]|uniref:DUF5666 domain-containing protein n=1 Tax=Halalkalibaculum roseum TaxID=2709311 RepID=A0A6M1T0F5_9BACT|nr:DUF5666 domain-containing protein [Halalkalibaculum roseum]NGP76974.1 hypothetical protein [Halalkalibaculum roseum]